jgi:hypothetical protein
MTFFGFILAHIWEIILAIIAIIWALLKFNYNLFNRVIRTEVENNNYKLKEEIRNEFKEDIKKEVRHEVGNRMHAYLNKKLIDEE